MNVEMVELNLDGHIDERGIQYIGRATRRSNGQWVCLADVKGCLCLVEVSVKIAIAQGK
jgi:hypothetical protein